MSAGPPPLAGMRVLVTRAAHQSDELADRLRKLGAEPVVIAVLQISLPVDCTALDVAIRNAAQHDWLVFASANAVRFFFERMHAIGCQPPEPPKTRYATIGPGTAQTLRAFNRHAEYYPDEYIAESFVSQFPGFPALQGVSVLCPRGSAGRPHIPDSLRAAGAQVDTVICYETRCPDDAEHCGQRLREALSSIQAITLASSQTARNVRDMLERVLPVEQVTALLADQTAVCIGPQTAAAARTCGFGTVHQAQPYTLDGLVEQLISLHTERSFN